ncbi:hypothetical protein TcWFU_007322 [Taenia crassiceps]|uniref:Uncharacterized protein n=1 Tax=Taenia crassiceps TaxID=6207 RepID=A0ABR4Q0U4_9CEST
MESRCVIKHITVNLRHPQPTSALLLTYSCSTPRLSHTGGLMQGTDDSGKNDAIEMGFPNGPLLTEGPNDSQ